jgi:predicted DCC family thiol-disulfide oxidoreductase YuxK
MTEPQRVTLLYDEDCGFCRWSADKIRAWDSRRALAFVSIQGETGTDLLYAVPPERRLDSMHALTLDGRVWSGGEAVRVIVARLPGGAVVASIARAFPEATEIVYRQVVRNRQRLGRWLGMTACSVDPSRVDATSSS